MRERHARWADVFLMPISDLVVLTCGSEAAHDTTLAEQIFFIGDHLEFVKRYNRMNTLSPSGTVDRKKVSVHLYCNCEGVTHVP